MTLKIFGNLQMKNIFLRNRSNYGAQITCLPFLYSTKNKDKHGQVRVIYKENLGYFYNQFSWIDQNVKSVSTLSDLKLIKRKEQCISLRPNSLALRISFFVKGAYPKDGIVKTSSNKNSPFLDNQTTFDESIYRGIQYLRLYKKDISPECIAASLKAPFIHEAEQSNLSILNTQKNCNILIMVGGGAGDFKKWGVKNFLEACKKIGAELKQSVTVHVLIGPDEIKEKKQIQAAAKNTSSIKLYEKMSISDISKLVRICDITIANDCGPSHVAQCMQNGFVGIFDKEKKEWFYQNQLSTFLTPPEKQPITSIKVDDVVEQSLYIINKKKEK